MIHLIHNPLQELYVIVKTIVSTGGSRCHFLLRILFLLLSFSIYPPPFLSFPFYYRAEAADLFVEPSLIKSVRRESDVNLSSDLKFMIVGFVFAVLMWVSIIYERTARFERTIPQRPSVKKKKHAVALFLRKQLSPQVLG